MDHGDHAAERSAERHLGARDQVAVKIERNRWAGVSGPSGHQDRWNVMVQPQGGGGMLRIGLADLVDTVFVCHAIISARLLL